MLLKGIIHVHSNYSFDGQHSLEEIAAFGRKRGYQFIGMSEHSDTLNEEKMARYVKECEAVSTQGCLVIPGIEFTCENNLHLVGLGVHHYTDTKDPLKVAEFIHQQGGVAIVAHPIRYNYRIPQNLVSAVDGIEVWNAAYDGRFVPNTRSLNLINEKRKQHGSLFAFGAQDLHRIRDYGHVETHVSCSRLEKDTNLLALKQGKFTFSNRYIRLDSRAANGLFQLARIHFLRKIYLMAKGVRDSFWGRG
jgi:predicted metal-dependent phosphoesterase TrpH